MAKGLPPNHPFDYMRAIKSVVIGHFNQCAADFADNPGGDAWTNLEDAMWARQAISQPETMKRAIAELPGIGVGHWIKQLRNIHEGKP